MDQNLESIWISVGSSRKETSWKNTEYTWPELVERLKKTVKTPETLKEYLAFKKDLQDERKDVGGFVGGVIQGGRRKKGSVTRRQLITLDVDFGSMDFFDDFQMTYNCAAFVYGTHKHQPTSPRLRLVIPLSRDVPQDEYEAVARKVAGNLGIELFDPTTFQPERLMYWPSTPKDVDYYWDEQKGPWLDPDKVLGSYIDWKDTSQWPISEKVSAAIQLGIKKQGNPLIKPGMIGAFCRAYSMSEAIDKFLTDEYSETDRKDRYTYKLGSTSAGVVLYDDLFAYSHHSTDPAGGRTSNAFDLVRIHKFGHLDSDVAEKTNISKYPSHKEMEMFAGSDDKVRQESLERLKERFNKDFPDLVIHEAVVQEEIDWEWTKKLEKDPKTQQCNSTIQNVLTILRHHHQFKGLLCMNWFSYRKTVKHDLPWRQLGFNPYWVDQDDAGLRNFLEFYFKISKVVKIHDAVTLVMEENGFHPVRDYLNGLEWDGEKRIETMLPDYLGTDNTKYVRETSKKVMVGAVARVMRPGIKFDNAMILVGPQRKGKSTFIRNLGKDWYSDSFGDIKNNKAAEQIQGVWIMEMGELAGMKKADVNEMKHFMSKQDDTFRPAFGRQVQTFPRQTLFWGSTNEDEFLVDPTGNSRYWPQKILQQEPSLSVFTDMPDNVDQLWAEAYEMYKKGETTYLDSETEQLAMMMQDAHTEKSVFGPLIDAFLEMKLPDSWPKMSIGDRQQYIAKYGQSEVHDDDLLEVGSNYRNYVCTMQIWCEVLGKKAADMTPYFSKQITNYLKIVTGWQWMEQENHWFSIYKAQKYFMRMKTKITEIGE